MSSVTRSCRVTAFAHHVAAVSNLGSYPCRVAASALAGSRGTFDDGVQYQVGKARDWKSTILGGEGLIVNLAGAGRF